MEAAEQKAVAGLNGRAGLNPVMADAAARALRAAGEAWRELSARECGDLALIEVGLEGALYQRRLQCRIKRDNERVEALGARYGK